MSSATASVTHESASGTVPELRVTPNHAQILMFSAATWNRHHIHYNKDAALAEGLAGVVVQRGLIGNLLARMLTDWLQGCGEIRELSWKVLQSALPDCPLRCQGVITGRDDAGARRFVLCELKVLNDQDQTVATGAAKVELFSKG